MHPRAGVPVPLAIALIKRQGQAGLRLTESTVDRRSKDVHFGMRERVVLSFDGEVFEPDSSNDALVVDPSASLRLSPDELLDSVRDPAWPDRDGLEWIVLDFTGSVSTGAAAELALRIPNLAIPVIGFGATTGVLRNAVDVSVDDEQDLIAVCAACCKNPQAAAVLVQVLRATARLRVADALAVESLGYATLQAGPEFAHWLAGRKPVAGRSAPAEEVVRLRRHGGHLSIRLNAPESRNALSAPMRDALTEAFQLVMLDPAIDSMEVSANGPCFSAGGDLSEFGTVTDPMTAHEIRMRRMPARFFAAVAHRCHVRVHGACVGAGIELPAFAGRISAETDAFFQLPEIGMGLIPGSGGCVSIPRRIGRQRTAFMALTGRRIGASEALAWGLVDGVNG